MNSWNQPRGIYCEHPPCSAALLIPTIYNLAAFLICFLFNTFYGESLTEITSQALRRHLCVCVTEWYLYSSALGSFSDWFTAHWDFLFSLPLLFCRLKKPHVPVAVLILHNIQSNMHTKHLIKTSFPTGVHATVSCFCLLLDSFFVSAQQAHSKTSLQQLETVVG